jgi:hypothetical protein
MDDGRTLFDGVVHVHYRFVNVHRADDEVAWEIGAERRGQVNGLCRAAVPGVMSLVTGLHTGPVPFVVELHDAEPTLDELWEEAVEVSFTAARSRSTSTGSSSGPARRRLIASCG